MPRLTLPLVIASIAASAALAALQPLAADAQTPTPRAPASAADSAYLAAVRPLVSGDTSADFTALRRQLAATTFYAPDDPRRAERRRELFDRMNARDPLGAAAVADTMLAENYLDADAQLVAGITAVLFGDSTAGRTHLAIARAIIRSIESTGDGRTPERPLLVLSVIEEGTYLGATGLRRTGVQEVTRCGDRACHRLEVERPDGSESFPLYFDLSLPAARLTRRP